jgi:predicted acylesterase/phospholipase RssA
MSKSITDADVKIEAIDRAREVLRSERVLEPDEFSALCQDLVAKDQFAYATELLLSRLKLDQNLRKDIPLKDYETLAKYIYKDTSLPSSVKFDRAIKELEDHCNLLHTDHCETLGLAGAIYKYKWQYDHKFTNLSLSLYYYGKGFRHWKSYLSLENKVGMERCNDDGYTAINYAYINELTAIDKLEEIGTKLSDLSEIERLLEEARSVRYFILEHFGFKPFEPVTTIPKHHYWALVTIAEAFFGLADYENAAQFIRFSIFAKREEKGMTDNARALAWQLRTFSQQLSSIAYLQYFQKEWINNLTTNHTLSRDYLVNRGNTIVIGKIEECLALLADPLSTFSDGSAKTEIRENGKLGLALSGGGFRAAIFHIGVLAALAEHDILKDVEVISCVSGGSIIGAYYHLKLKYELQEKPDGQVDYIKIVEDIERDFLKGVRSNLRMRIFLNPIKNLRMVMSKNYSRTHRLGELYEDFLYKKIKGDNEPIVMEDLIIKPFNDAKFSITTDNWKRKNKVPQLILNATSVNTGHNWQFTASWMGEPPGTILRNIDMKPRLRRMYYREAPGDYKKFRLGYAVGASSCVPMLFEPLPMYDLYEDAEKQPIKLQLVDGGVHDNQGIASLLEQECKNMIISDASGQMSSRNNAAEGELSVFYRADMILQERLREIQFQDVFERNNTAQINKLTAMHLKSDLIEKPISWITCKDVPRKLFEVENDPNQLHTEYGVLREIQKLLSGIRTDLDSFNETESDALMYSGYVQTLHKLRASGAVTKSPVKKGVWQFMKIKPFMTDQKKSDKISDTLRIASKLALKVYHLSKLLIVISAILGIAGLALFVWWSDSHWEETILNYEFKTNHLFILVAAFAVGLVSNFVADMINYKAYIRRKAILCIVAILGCLASIFYIMLLNPFYNKAGRVPRDN